MAVSSIQISLEKLELTGKTQRVEEPSAENELALVDSNVEKGVRTAFLSQGGGA